MEAQAILYLILVIISIDFVFEVILDYLNFKNIPKELPQVLEGIYDRDDYFKSLDYHQTRTRFSFFTSSFSFVLVFVVLSFGILGTLDQWVGIHFMDQTTQALVFFGILYFGSDLINIPFQTYSTFVIEDRFGFNKTTRGTFVLDKIKGYLLTIIIGGLILVALITLIQFIGIFHVGCHPHA